MASPTKTQDTTIPVGSVVKVIDEGQGYSSYSDMAAFMGLDKWNKHSPFRYSAEGKSYTVVAKAQHEHAHYGEVLGLQDEDGHQLMIGISGVELVQEAGQPRLSSQVELLEERLEAVTKERDELNAKLEAIRSALV